MSGRATVRRWTAVAAVLVAATALGASARATEAVSRQVGDDYQLDYVRAHAPEIEVAAPAGATVEIFEGFRSVAHGRTPLSYRASSPGEFIVSLRTTAGRSWEAHVAARANLRAVLRAAPGAARTRITVVAPPVAAAMSAQDFAALRSAVHRAPSSDRFHALTQASGGARFSAEQAGALLDELRANRDRLRALSWLRERLEDPDTAPELYGHFPLLADRRRAREVLER